MEDDGFIHFHAPEQNKYGNWFVRSVDKNDAGNYRFLAFAAATRPFVTTMANSTAVLLVSSHVMALEEYNFYYAYHAGGTASSPVPPKIIKSEVMDF